MQGAWGLILSQGTRSHMLQWRLKSLHVATKTQHSHVNKHKKINNLCSGSRTLRTAWLIHRILQSSFLFGFGMTWKEAELGASLLLIHTFREHSQTCRLGLMALALSPFSDALCLRIRHSATLSSEDRVCRPRTCASRLCRLSHHQDLIFKNFICFLTFGCAGSLLLRPFL